jgi:rhomboid family GlyGly-CTERM serine protease
MVGERDSPANLKSHRFGLGTALLGLSVLVMVLLLAGGDSVRAGLRYERSAVLDGELWRLMTAHWVHSDLEHLLLNALGASIITTLFLGAYRPLQWATILAGSVVAIDLGFLLWEPQLEWYVGVSGALHGALTAGAVAWWRTESKLLASALTLVIVGKFTWEQLHGASVLAGDMPIIVNSHLYGAVGGSIVAIVLCLRSTRSTSPSAPL